LKKTNIIDTISHLIEQWFEIEKYTKKKYAVLANNTDNAQAKALFNQLSSAGDRHAKVYKE